MKYFKNNDFDLKMALNRDFSDSLKLYEISNPPPPNEKITIKGSKL